MDVDRLKKRLSEIDASPKNVRFEDLEALLENHICGMYPDHYNHHGSGSHHAFTVGDQTFTIVKPSSGCVKEVYVRKFLDAMEELGLYEG